MLVNVSPDVARAIASRVLRSIQEPFAFRGQSLEVGASIGRVTGAELEANATGESLLRAADKAMYRAKSRGGGIERASERPPAWIEARKTMPSS